MIGSVAATVGLFVPTYFQVALPSNPGNGFALDRDGTILLALLDPDDASAQVVRYKVEGKSLVEVQKYDRKYEGQLEILPTASGLAIVDYESGFVGMFTKSGKLVWEAHARFPNAARLDAYDNVWFFFNSGNVAKKTADSSAVEFILDSDGAEIDTGAPSDIVPLGTGGFYLLDAAGNVEKYAPNGKKQHIAKHDALRMIPAKSGGVILYSGQFVHIADNGTKRVLWDLPASIDRNLVKRISVTPKGSLGIAGQSSDGRSGFALILPNGLEG